MENFQLSLFLKIVGLGSTSGLVYQNDTLFLISDSSTYLYEYKLSEEKLNKIALVENPQENIAKKDKPDFEAITTKGKDLIIIGSGSTENRNKTFIYDLISKKSKEKDLTELYTRIKTQLQLTNDELNIEGIIISNKDIYLFQRGNGELGKNGIIYAFDNRENSKLTFTPFDLPKIKNVATTFTDGIVLKDKIYFLAAAEDTTSTYHDGEVLGSILGIIDVKTMKLERHFEITNTHKFEGITYYKHSETEIEFLLCEDNDSEELVSNIYKLVIQI